MKNSRKRDFKFDSNCPYTAYVMGFIWADGWLQGRNNKYEIVNVEITQEDFNEIYYLFDKLKIHLFSSKRNRPNRKPQATLRYSDINFIDFLIENDFVNRKEKGFKKILSCFNEFTIPYFIKGLFDGDGCFYLNVNNKACQISLCSSLNQKYEGLEEIIEELNINFTIYKRKTSKEGYSQLRITSKDGCGKLINFLGNSRNIGLPRKNYKIDLMMNYVNN
jgi:intein/homing endonuclease